MKLGSLPHHTETGVLSGLVGITAMAYDIASKATAEPLLKKKEKEKKMGILT